MKLFKIPSPYVSTPLSLIINESFQTDVFPTKMKQAKVIPLHKLVKLPHALCVENFGETSTFLTVS